MPVTESGKNWQKGNRDKVKKYVAKYDKSRAKTTVYLEKWVTEQIDKVKEPEQTYGNWVRLHVEEWAKIKCSETSTSLKNKE
ncbi:hypothetical protein NUACC21_29080 [Scytonema sp. NUACC21]